MTQTVLVTGATSGIGLILANELTNKGFNVFGTSRNPALQKGSVSFELLPLDLISEKSMRTCVELLLIKSASGV